MKPTKKKAPRPISPPDLPLELETASFVDDGLQDDRCYSEVAIADWDGSSQSADHVFFEAVLLENPNFSHTFLRQPKLRDVRAMKPDCSNANWPSASFTRVELLDGRLTGIQSPESVFTDVVFVRCKADLAGFFKASFHDVRFEDCILTDADFQGADLRGVCFRGCDLRGANFTGAKLDQADFRGARLEGLALHPADLKGLIIDTAQAMELYAYFAQILGVNISDS